jgi:probable F420-dependent oxidoreductase
MLEFGAYLPQYGSAIQPDVLRDVAQQTEAEGFDSLWLGEHLGLPQPPKTDTDGFGEYPVRNDRPWLETMTGLAFLSAVTERCRLGTAAIAVPWRQPFIAAKELASIDNLSKGRLILGVGSGNFPEEFAVIDVSYKDRGRLTDEALAAWQALFTQDEPRFEGEHYSFSGLSFYPKPVQKPWPPMWVAGQLSSPVRRRVARFGDGWMSTLRQSSPADVRAGIEKLNMELDAAGRPGVDLDICLWAPTRVGEPREAESVPWRDNLISGTPEQVYETYSQYVKAGCNQFVICVGGPPEIRMRQLRAFTKGIIPELRKLEPSAV